MRHISHILANGPYASLLSNDARAEALGIETALKEVRLKEFWALHGVGAHCPVRMCKDCIEVDGNNA